MDFRALNHLQVWLGFTLIAVILITMRRPSRGSFLARAAAASSLGIIVAAKQFCLPAGRSPSALEICLAAAAVGLAGYWVFKAIQKRRGG